MQSRSGRAAARALAAISAVAVASGMARSASVTSRAPRRAAVNIAVTAVRRRAGCPAVSAGEPGVCGDPGERQGEDDAVADVGSFRLPTPSAAPS